MTISRSELKTKYGIDLPKGKYSIKQNGDKYDIYTVKDDTDGCPLVGFNKTKGRVDDSRQAFATLMQKHLTPARNKKEKVYITIV